MKILKLVAASLLAAGTLTACGGGGGTAAIPITSNTVVSGIATKGPFLKNSAVKVYAVSNGVKGALITSATTSDDNGSYSADLGSYTGPIVVEVSGSYQDEATGHTVSVDASAPIRAALPAVQGATTLPVTPLTELAVAQTGGTLTPTAIAAANSMVSTVFKVDVVGTMPVVPTASAMANATESQKEYTLALAAISQMASAASGTTDTDKIMSTLSTLSQGISSSGMSSEVSSSFQGALTTFVSTNPNNQTGVSTVTGSGLTAVGTPTKSYVLSLAGNASPAGGIQFDLSLPAGVTLNVNSLDSAVMSSSFMMGGATTDAYLAAKAGNGSISVGIVAARGISAGNFATLTCNIASGTTAPEGSAFTVSGLKVYDLAGSALSGATVSVK